MKNMPVENLEAVEKIINHYFLFKDKNVYVAYSGGKDSFFLCMILKELGYYVHPIIIDIGYNSNWSIAERNINSIGLEVIKLDIKYIDSEMPEIREELEVDLDNIKRIKNGDSEKITICTPCYNSKMLILQKWAENNNIHTVAIGHHGTDAITSLLKSFYMYLDRWEYHHQEFKYDNFRKLIISQKKLFCLEKEEFLLVPVFAQLEDLIKNQKIGTDEPILQYLDGTSIRICRPLFGIYENEIKSYFKNQDVHFNESECFVTGYRNKNMLTPREMIQYELLQKASTSLLDYLLSLVKKCMNKNGYLEFNVRNNRSKILGEAYKDKLNKR